MFTVGATNKAETGFEPTNGLMGFSYRFSSSFPMKGNA